MNAITTGNMTLADAAKRLGLSWGQAWRLLLVGQLEGKKNGRGRWYVTAASVEQVAETRQHGRREATSLMPPAA